MICGLIDSSIWQSDQQVRRREFSLLELSCTIYCISWPRLCMFHDATLTTRNEAAYSHRRRDFRRPRRRSGKYDVNASQQVCDNEYSLFTRCAPTKSARLYYARWDEISFDVNHNDLRHACVRATRIVNLPLKVYKLPTKLIFSPYSTRINDLCADKHSKS